MPQTCLERSLRERRYQALELIFGGVAGPKHLNVLSGPMFALRAIDSELAGIFSASLAAEVTHVQVEADSRMGGNCCFRWRSVCVALWSPNHQRTDGPLSVPKAS